MKKADQLLKAFICRQILPWSMPALIQGVKTLQIKC
jgi:hypothetical protein